MAFSRLYRWTDGMCWTGDGEGMDGRGAGTSVRTVSQGNQSGQSVRAAPMRRPRRESVWSDQVGSGHVNYARSKYESESSLN